MLLKINFLILVFSANAQYSVDNFSVSSNYQKQVFYVPMRDGVKLYTVVYSPKEPDLKFPILITRTPYGVGPYEDSLMKPNLGPGKYLQKDGYIFVYQDVRGKYMSEGEFVDVRPYLPLKKNKKKDIDESSDAYDTVEWLLKKLKNHNGKVGFWGTSYPGFYAAMAALDAHPAVKAVSPQAPVGDWFLGDDFRRNGAFWLPHAFNFFVNFGVPRPQPVTKGLGKFKHTKADGYEWFLKNGSLKQLDSTYMKGEVKMWKDLMDHPNYDEYWKQRSIFQHFKNVKPAVLVVGGLFDAENVNGATKLYESIEKNNTGNKCYLALGPWYHGGWHRSKGTELGPVKFYQPTSQYYQESVEYRFFTFYLKGKKDDVLMLPEASVFETGSNQWKFYEQWPPKGLEKHWYLGRGGKLNEGNPGTISGTTQWESDPNKPVPHTAEITNRMEAEYMVEDQRFASKRNDVVVFKSDPLEQDFTVAGAVDIELFFSSTGTDGDLVVKIIDAFPDGDTSKPAAGYERTPMSGYEMMVRGDAFRLRFREKYDEPKPLTPNQVERVNIPLNAINHCFKRGHKIKLQVQGSWFPLVERNPQNFIPNISYAKPSDYMKAKYTLYHDKNYPSNIRWNVVRYGK